VISVVSVPPLTVLATTTFKAQKGSKDVNKVIQGFDLNFFWALKRQVWHFTLKALF